jgi:putative tricarboxylic transport membrane protein
VEHTTADRVGGTLATWLGLLSVHEAIRLYPEGQGWLAGDHTFPAILGIGLFVLGTMIGSGFRAESFWLEKTGKKERRNMIGCMAIMLCYVLLLPIAGYLLSTWLAGTMLFRVVGSRHWLVSLLLSALVTGAFHFAFVEWLYMSFPKGFLGI